MIKIYWADQQKYLKVNKRNLGTALRTVLKKSGHHNISISIALVDNKQIRRLNRKYLNRNESTDVLAFPLADSIESGKENLLGEIVASTEQALHEARRRNYSPHQELALYCVHGLLHLLGYDDITPKKRRAMEKKQSEILRRPRKFKV